MSGWVDFGHGPIKAWVLHYGVKNQKLSIYKFRMGTADLAQISTASTVNFHVDGAPDLSLGLQSMPKLLSGLEQCRTDLLRYWNMGPPELHTVAAPAIGDVRAVFTSQDFPEEAQSRDQEGSATFLLFVSEQGDIAGCDVVQPSGVPAFDGMGCQVIRSRAKFKPAVDSLGKPVRSAMVTPPITWRLED